jgi:SAM-dependent methyltransferase
MVPTSELSAHLYDWSSEQMVDDVQLSEALARETAGPVLEMGCGSGRLLEGIARSGKEAVGVDISLPMLGRARRRLDGAGARFYRGHMTSRLPGRSFGLIILARHQLGYLRRRVELERMLEQVRDHLAPGGTLLLDLASPEAVYGAGRSRPVLQRAGWDDWLNGWVRKWGGVTVHAERSEFEQTDYYAIDFLHAPRRLLRETARMRVFSVGEAEQLLQVAGLRAVGSYSDYDLHGPLGSGGRLLFLARVT